MSRLSRRQFLAWAGTGASAALLTGCTRQTSVSPLEWKPPPTLAPTPTLRGPAALDAAAALARLIEGNQRYVTTGLVHPDQTAERRKALESQQEPFAVVLTCADSRVPPEVIFDQGLGDLFVVRVAGNILSDTLLGSIEYAVEHLKTPLILVLGHKRCGAVSATVDAVEKGTEAPGHIATLVEALRPAVEEVRQAKGDVLDNAIRANVKRVLKELRTTSPILEEKLGTNVLKTAGGYHDLDTGAVEIIG